MQEQELKQEITTIDNQVKSVVITNQESFTDAGNITLTIDGMIKQVKEYWKEPKEKAFQAHKAITAKESEMLGPLKEMRNMVQKKISAYLTEIDRKRKEEQAKLDEQRRKQEEAEKKKLAERAARAEESGKTEKAEALREKAEEVYVPPVVVQPEVEKTTRTEFGTISKKEKLNITVLDPLEVIKAVARKDAPITIVNIKEAKLKDFIKLSKLKEFPGCEIREVIDAQFRAK
jgi:hypothetical protein